MWAVRISSVPALVIPMVVYSSKERKDDYDATHVILAKPRQTKQSFVQDVVECYCCQSPRQESVPFGTLELTNVTTRIVISRHKQLWNRVNKY